MRAQYEILKASAAKREIEFTLTFNYFKRFALKFCYLTHKGNLPDSITIDRRNNLRGYVPGNIQPLTRVANSIKQAKYDAVRIRKGMAWKKKYGKKK